MQETNQNQEPKPRRRINLDGINLFLSIVNRFYEDLSSRRIVMFGHGRHLRASREEEATRKASQEADRNNHQR